MNPNLEKIASQLGEHFSQYLVIVRGEKTIAWKSSDRTWAAGAAQRYLTTVDEEDRMDSREQGQSENWEEKP